MGTTIPNNRATFSGDELVRALAQPAATLGPLPTVAGVTTDSRADVDGKLFVALRGERFDGHDFVPDVLARGAAAVLVERALSSRRGRTDAARMFVVPDTLTALGRLAAFHRQRWGNTVVAVAGSAGKTTTRSAITALLSSLGGSAVHRTAGNLNNRVGVPMVLLGLETHHETAVLEIGTNLRGEVALLSELAAPEVGVLTLVALEHSAGIGGLDDVEAEEGDLLAALPRRGMALVNGDDERARRQLVRAGVERQLTYGMSTDCDYRVERVRSRSMGSDVRVFRPHGEPLEVWVPLLGRAGALASAAAIAVVEHVRGEPIAAAEAEAGLANAGEGGRLTPRLLGDGTLLLDDSYNSNPGSVESSLETAEELAARRRLVLVLGEMRELGALSESEHRAVGERVARSPAAVLIAVGGDARWFLEPPGKASETEHVSDAAAAYEALARLRRPGDVVLVKGSRGVGLEHLVERLVNEVGPARPTDGRNAQGGGA